MACHKELVRELTKAGYHFYRLGVQMMEEMRQDDAYSAVLSAIKDTLDPAGVLSPGRYEARATSAAAERALSA
jgi:FAD/FMN-containing dehydrogenase